MSVFSELQDDNKEKWLWVKELPVTWRYKLDMMGLEYEDDQPGLDEVMIPSGFQPMDNYNVIDDILNSETDKENGVPNVSANGVRKARV